MATENREKSSRKDVGGLIIASLFILIAVVMLWDTTNMMDSDSYVFPRAVAIVMIALNILLIFRMLTKRITAEEKKEAPDASSVRRVALIIGMLFSCVLMSYLGFFVSAIITFLLLIRVSMYDEWTVTRKLLYPAVALALVTGFYLLFSEILLVPLPTSTVF
ncbi:MAG: hypothetical protein CSA26_06255 [Desulfobacterales bacterium]|nr:MAG: hypothetical protein CSA26_06255 [Desulfobacterales bacterium]